MDFYHYRVVVFTHCGQHNCIQTPYKRKSISSHILDGDWFVIIDLKDAYLHIQFWPTQTWFLELASLLADPPLGRFPSDMTCWLRLGAWFIASSSGFMEVMGVAPEWSVLMCSGLSAEITNTILNSRAPSTRHLYALKWRSFLLLV